MPIVQGASQTGKIVLRRYHLVSSRYDSVRVQETVCRRELFAVCECPFKWRKKYNMSRLGPTQALSG